MKFEEIEARRAEHGIRQSDLCESAGVHPVTYGRWKNGTSQANTATLGRVEAALEALISQREAAE